ncbi:MAG: BNR-4 repeat-containing protein [Saprospiraceae bacterium]|nr:BNR-4 repeat-containing protein [Saprospiraceae bacterium]
MGRSPNTIFSERKLGRKTTLVDFTDTNHLYNLGLVKISLLSILVFMTSACSNVKPKEIIFKENGSWCWFQDERAIIYDNKLIFGSVADRYGKNGELIDGNIEVTTYDLKTNSLLGTFVLHEKLEGDDHDVPAFLPLQDGRLLSVYSGHNLDSLIRYRISAEKNPLVWGDEETFVGSDAVTYSNLHHLQSINNANGRIYNFYRGANRSPYYMFSDDQGDNWKAGYHLMTFEKKWPYLKYASDGVSKIHFITTESHPKFWECGIYHAYFENDKVYDSYGKLIGDLTEGPVQPTEATRIFKGDDQNNAWTIDLQLDKNEMPYIAYSVRKDIDHIQYRYARWDGQAWQDYFLAYAGRALYEVEYDYSGLVALDPDDPDVVYISSDADPVTEAPLISARDQSRHYEIFKGTTTDLGESWDWVPLTKNSTQDNVRPIMPKGNGDFSVVLWLRGSIKSYKDYSFDVIGIINP